MPFKMHKIIYFFQQIEIKMCLPTIPKILDLLSKTNLIFIWPEYEGCHSVYIF